MNDCNNIAADLSGQPLETESSIPVVGRGGVPHYPESEGLQERLSRCIEHELYYGGNHEAAAAAIIRDVNLGYIRDKTAKQEAFGELGLPSNLVTPIAVSERLPGEGDCDAEGRLWVWSTAGAMARWQLVYLKFVRNVSFAHWRPFHAIPLPQAGEVQP